MKSTIKKIVFMMLALIMALGMIVPMVTIETEAVSYFGSSSYASGPYYSRLLAVVSYDNDFHMCVIV